MLVDMDGRLVVSIGDAIVEAIDIVREPELPPLICRLYGGFPFTARSE